MLVRGGTKDREQLMTNQSPAPTARVFKPGDSLSAADINKIAQSIVRRMTGVGGVSVNASGNQILISLKGQRKPPTILRQYVVKSNLEDCLVCRSFDANKVEGTDDIHILKPWVLRYSEWDFDANSGAFAPDGEIYEYDTDTYTTRTNTGLVDPEVQKITQDYYVDSVIYAMNIGPNLLCNPFAVSSATSGSPVAEVRSRLIDINVDARAWAVA